MRAALCAMRFIPAPAGNTLTADEWRQLPALLSARTAAYWDKVHQNILLVTPALDGRTLKVAVQPDFRVRGATMNAAGTAFKIDAQALSDRKTYIPIWGGE